MGILYQIRNVENDMPYIGMLSRNTKKRRNQHFSLLRLNKHDNDYLQKAFNKYGEDSFRFEILQELPDDKLLQAETDELSQYIKNGKIDRDRCYNLVATPHRPVMTEETKHKLSVALMGKPKSVEHRRKISERQKGNSFFAGRKHTKESKLLMAAAKIGTKASEETLKKMSQSQKGHNRNVGLKQSEEWIAKRVAATRGKKRSDEFRLFCSERVRGTMSPTAKLTEEIVFYIRERLKQGCKQYLLARELGICQSTISSIKHGNTWSHI